MEVAVQMNMQEGTFGAAGKGAVAGMFLHQQLAIRLA